MRMIVKLPPELLYKKLYEHLNDFNITLKEAEHQLKALRYQVPNGALGFGSWPGMVFHLPSEPGESYAIDFIGDYILPDEFEVRSHREPFEDTSEAVKAKHLIYKIHGEFAHLTNQQYYKIKNDNQSGANHHTPSLTDAMEPPKKAGTTVFNKYTLSSNVSLLAATDKNDKEHVHSATNKFSNN